MTARRWLWAVQALVTVAVIALVVRALTQRWAEFRALHVTLEVRPLWLAGSVLLVLVTYVTQIEAWRRLLAGWNQHLPFRVAARAWSLANLGRYVPGKVWSIAGLVALAQRGGVAPAPAAASAFASQAVAIGTGIAVGAAATPHALSAWRLALAALAAAATVAALVWEPTARLLNRLSPIGGTLEPLHARAVAAAVAFSTLGWATYGGAFWMLARGLVAAGGGLSLTLATGVFALGYILSWLTLFAPGGIGVRELLFVGLLGPALGSGPAVAVSLASRVVLTATEAAAAALTFPLGRELRESRLEPS